jgi:hypothetical protein
MKFPGTVTKVDRTQRQPAARARIIQVGDQLNQKGLHTSRAGYYDRRLETTAQPDR